MGLDTGLLELNTGIAAWDRSKIIPMAVCINQNANEIHTQIAHIYVHQAICSVPAQCYICSQTTWHRVLYLRTCTKMTSLQKDSCLSISLSLGESRWRWMEFLCCRGPARLKMLSIHTSPYMYRLHHEVEPSVCIHRQSGVTDLYHRMRCFTCTSATPASVVHAQAS